MVATSGLRTTTDQGLTIRVVDRVTERVADGATDGVADGVEKTVKFEGEEAGAGYAAPYLDLIAAGFLICLALIMMIASFKLPVPGAIPTAPGLLPFLTAASLLLMAIMLGATAVKRKRDLAELISGAEPRDDSEHTGENSGEKIRTFLLIAVVGIYIAALQLLAFQHNLKLGDLHFSVSAFEPVTIIMLVVIIQGAWRGPIWITTLLAIFWTLILSAVFQKAFEIPLPGSF